MSNLEENKNEKTGAPDMKSEAVNMPKTALVFEENEEEEIEATPVEEAEILPKEQVEEKDELEADEVECAEESASSDEEEFCVFDNLSEEYGEVRQSASSKLLGFEDDKPLLWKAYVPKFTEASEKRYKFIDEAPRGTNGGSETQKNNQTSRTFVKVEEVENASADAVAEDMEEERGDKETVIVNISGEARAEETNDAINVFKFAQDAPEQQTSEEDEEQKQIEELESLFGYKKTEDEGEAYDVEPDSSLFDEKMQELIKEEAMRELPHPILPKKETEKWSDAKEENFGLAEYEMPLCIDSKQKKPSWEYTSYDKRDLFKDKFLDKLLSVKIRLAVALVLTVIALFLENVVFGIDILSLMNLRRFSSAKYIFELCLVCALFFLSLPETVKAAKALGKRKVIPELSLALSFVVLLAYNIVLAVLEPTENIMLGLVYAVLVVFSVFATHCLHSADFTVFKAISEKGTKLVVDNAETRRLERENMALDGAVDECNSRTARMFKTGFPADFAEHCSKDAENTKNNLTTLILSFSVAVVISVISFFVGDGIISALSSLSLIIMLGIPAFAMLSHKLPMYFSEKEASVENGGILGEEAFVSYSEIDAVTFEDTEIFSDGDVALKSIGMKNKEKDIRKVIRYTASLFAAVGGPLARLFEQTLGKKVLPASRVTVEDDGVIGFVEGVEFMAGSAQFFLRHGIVAEGDDSGALANTKVMYAAEDGVICADFCINYSFSEEFAFNLNSYKENGIVSLIYSRDPNIDNEMLKFLAGGADAVRVMKKHTLPPHTEKVFSSLNAGAVTCGDKECAINLILLAKRYARFIGVLAMAELAFCAAGVVFASAVSLFSLHSAIGSFPLALWQALGCGALAIASGRIFNNGKKGK